MIQGVSSVLPAIHTQNPQSSSARADVSQVQQSQTSYTASSISEVVVYEKPQALSANPYAQSILNAIQAQLVSDADEGANTEALQARLEAGFEGFVEGYEEAAAQLSESGLLSEDVRSAIQETYTQVLDGVAALAERFHLESPIGKEHALAETPVVTPAAIEAPEPLAQPVSYSKHSLLIEAFSESSSDLQLVKMLQDVRTVAPTYERSASVSVGESRSFSFELTTADGDRVSIDASAMRVGVSQATFGEGGTRLAIGGSQSSQFSFTVDGDLDEGELSALNDLLGQVNTISEQFFSGDVAGAFERALSVSFDESEIVGFEYNARMVSVEKVEQRSAYTQPYVEPVLQQFAEQVDYAAQLAERAEQPRSIVADLVDLLSRQIYQNQPEAKLAAPIVERFL